MVQIQKCELTDRPSGTEDTLNLLSVTTVMMPLLATLPCNRAE